jgi:hypothetical protein
MKVKIGDTIYDSNKEPIMIIINDLDKENINNMSEKATMYCSFPDTFSEDEIKTFMGIKNKDNDKL